MEAISSAGEAEREHLPGYGLGSELKSCQNNGNLRHSCRRDGNGKLKKSVSFEEDVVVYLFDQESPTLMLLSESCTSPTNSFSSNLPAVTPENADLQWEDDFSVLEKTCCFHFHTFPLPTRDRSAPSRPERSSLSRSCLFLTYVTEADLEL
ncbi:class A basic helix-loop-helix protein 15 isoform X2 [Kryptolebias marmoratus]|uniref:class A basic helix-loop-helix protein 15 isoform X2 n=1 Tax=Kryptolebias marmoratus TaxID=37003 RepID=UPI0007F8F95B|nr:class A basic helix-loop-helix protein 15 isoform X2 [Kryptolebias marmoratus]